MKNLINIESRYLYYSAGLIVFCDAIAAPLRFFLEKIGLGFAAYIPKAVGIIMVVFAVFFQEKKPKVVVVFLTLLFLSAIVGLASKVSLFATGFAIFLFTPFILGLFTPIDEMEIKDAKLFLLVIFVITIFGIALDYFTQFPWEGLETEVMGVVVETSREWTNFNLERLAGFTRLSTTAAFYLSISGLFLYFFSDKFYVKLIIIILTVYFVNLTTNKTALGAVLLIVGLNFLFRFRVLHKWTIVSFMFFSIVFPLWAVTTFDLGMELSGEDEQMMFASFNARLQMVWPFFYDAIRSILIGNGLGGVGSPTKIDYFDNGELWISVSDNTFLYVLGWLGVCAVYIYFVFAKMMVLSVDKEGVVKVLGKIILFIFFCGVATDMLESVLPSYLLGLFLRQYSALCGDCDYEK